MKRESQKRIAICFCVAFIVFVFLNASWRSSAQAAAAAEATDISPSATVSPPTLRATTKPPKEVPPSSRTYSNSAFDFSLTYPSDLSVNEYDEGGGTKSIVFQTENAHVGFEMFITPDDGDDPLTPADIKLEFPTLEMQGTESLMVGTGTAAVAFASEVPGFGPTRELWFAHDGYLFEVLTYPNLGQWLAQIIDTIRFP